MIGLLNNLSPQVMGLLGLSLMQAAQPSATPQNIDLGSLLSNITSSAKAPESQQLPMSQSQSNYTPRSSYLTSFFSPSNNTDNTQNNRLAQLKLAAESTYPNNPTMQQVAISQALLESGINRPSTLATKFNNYFGIKGNDTTLPTTEYQNGVMQNTRAGFESNDSMADSFTQHKDLLSRRYKNVMDASNPHEAFQMLAQGGYATDPRYAQKLSNVHKRYVSPLYTRG